MNRTILTSTLLGTTLLLWSCVPLGQPLPPLVKVEQQAMNDTLQYALEYNKTSQAADWVNPDTARSGVVTPVRTFFDDQGRPCREFSTSITFNGGEQQKGYGTACRQSNGNWHVVSNGPPGRVVVVPGQPVYVYRPPKRYYGSPYTYYNPYPVSFSFSLGYLSHGSSMHIGSHYPGGSMWYPRSHWRPYKHRYYRPYRHGHHYRPHYRPHHRKHFRW